MEFDERLLVSSFRTPARGICEGLVRLSRSPELAQINLRLFISESASLSVSLFKQVPCNFHAIAKNFLSSM
jgi:hypothetical protein